MRSFDVDARLRAATPLAAVIIGAGFGGIGMARAFRQAGVHDFAILERSHDVGGVWRDNSYPGAACDVPSHLYSFSFEPNPLWSRTFARQPEIHAYLRHCARKFGIERHIKFGAEVERAEYDESRSVWRVALADGTLVETALLVTATGQLSRPVLPKLAGIETFEGRAFHSAHWDHDYPLSGKRVAVVGTGASAIQFVPAIADDVSRLTIFQRSPAYILPRPDRAYRRWRQTLFRRMPWTMKLHRASIYLRYEARALAFTRFKAMMRYAVGRPFLRLLSRQVPNAELRAKLTPDYPIGCKRILLSNDYLAAMSKPSVELVTAGIRRVTPNGIETEDGVHHRADAIVFGTGFAATEFLAPMHIVGRAGVTLNDAWRRGAQAYLGVAVPGFPNFFMLYGPNTNLGHNSIVYMLESQIAHVMRCWRAMRAANATAIDVDERRYRRFNAHVQKRLSDSVWSGCTSWYVDANGHNSTNWHGFTLSYRWLARFSSLAAYRMTRVLPGAVGAAGGVAVAQPHGWLEAACAGFLRALLRTTFRAVVGPPFGVRIQRLAVGALAPLMPGVVGVVRYRDTARDAVPVEVIAPKRGDAGGVILYLHGGAFCLGAPRTHRGVTTRLAIDSGMPVWVPDYRLAPEHPCPAALQDALSCYATLRDQGHAAGEIVVAGDSAGGALAIALAIALRERGDAAPAALLLISPVTDPGLTGQTLTSMRDDDPMIRRDWLEQGLRWYRAPEGVAAHWPLDADLRGLPPMLVQAGEQEVLLSDAWRLAERAAACGTPCRLEIHAKRWHVFHLQSSYLRSASAAVRTLADFARSRIAGSRAAAGVQRPGTPDRDHVRRAEPLERGSPDARPPRATGPAAPGA
ncbi:alpha/beta hydrolase fold domain-containing protein [Burkholderia thailandensis]|uniref:Flavin-binding monooxygenase-like family protein n=1 Tax=Burkholderia thailandensis TaxID=57975 RepID=A0AAW9CKW2_BURTH|nr:alpha/beta hydrolase fold domain-containing protein [Burkholderia thailandensis]MCS3392861.1 alpha/beta hydrolase fold domain-containing protein [Burkholderia thailandensis]MCS6425667.1 alpha/beta hydrolase fold domain-containing protein [Burkholderia thailandensis]MCS6453317.1 alpha/beta hydrolase fold domain-containing protein [Burkholderia thailandensis]MCS6464925.1 alpha/beta hydrolase fold domain-containing protein [Burkholderia thailandensis]MCS6482539.1 alpha/beta hydrolase fold doma